MDIVSSGIIPRACAITGHLGEIRILYQPPILVESQYPAHMREDSGRLFPRDLVSASLHLGSQQGFELLGLARFTGLPGGGPTHWIGFDMPPLTSL
ncbi:hypothetical protein VTI74DRAFT_6123 [Chaetomium olivicolor]